MTFKDYVGLASDAQKGLTVVIALASAIAPAFLGTQPSIKWFAVVGGVVGTVAGALVGLTARQRSNTGGWIGGTALAVCSLLFALFVRGLANGSLANQYPWLEPGYNFLFAAPLFGDALFGFGYALFWGAVASFIRFAP